jgi:hypothetical protein
MLLNMPVNNNTLTDLQEKIWHVIKPNVTSNPKTNYLSNYQYVLKKNDIIKLGRIKFVIRDMNIVGGNFETSPLIFRPYLDHE